MPNWKLSEISDPSLQKKIIENETKVNQNRIEAGFIGKIWGTKHSSNNIARIICLGGVVLLFITVGCSLEVEIQNLLIQSATSLITLSLGYLFGSNLKSDN